MKSKTDERTVAFGHVNESTVSRDVQEQVASADTIPAGRIAGGVPEFIKVDDYTTFVAEYVLKDGDIVVHFYPPPERSSPWTDASKYYWSVTFAKSLDSVAQEYFKATAPRLQAKFTQEVNSWWFRARGYGHIINLKGFIEAFFERLDVGLEHEVQ